MEKFTHLLITRFNIRITGMGPERIESPVMDEAWLAERVLYFEKYCAPSVLAQTKNNFRWLLYFDPATSPSLFDQLAYVKQASIPVEFAFADSFESMLDDVRQRIRALPTEYVITSRLDNDDVISNDYIETVQQLFSPVPRTIINFHRGFEADVTNGILKKWNMRFRNQFLSMIERTKAEEIVTVYGYAHWKSVPGETIVNNSDKPMWVYTRHSLNYSGQAINAIPMVSVKVLERFPSLAKEFKISVLNTLKYAARWFPKMLFRKLKLTQ